MDYEMISVEIEGKVAILTIRRPRALNALCDGLVAEMNDALCRIGENPEAAVLLLTGGPNVFAAGADLKEMARKSYVEVLEADFSGCCEKLADFDLPVVGAVAGYALGGGCELVEMCDVVVAADTARFGHPEITVGTMPGAGGTQRLPRALGKAKAMDLLLTGRMMDAAEAERAGLVSRVVAEDNLIAEARGVAERIASYSRPVLKLMKKAVLKAFSMPLPEGLDFERKMFQMTFGLEDRKEGMEAFTEKRKPRFAGR